MKRPTMLAVDDDRAVLNAVNADLRARYAKDYRLLAADSGASALRSLEQLRLKDEPVALLLVDQRMPGMTGVDFLERSRQLYPEARRVLLTAYADTDAAIRAVNTAGVDYYLMKPWDPPEERLYPILDDLLETWRAPPTTADLRVIGHRWSRASHDLRDFLARNLIPYRWIDVEQAEEGLQLLAIAGLGDDRLPVALLDDGTALVAPTAAEIAEHVGLRVRAERPYYDVVVVGAGPAGLAAGVYAASEGLQTLLIEREAPGGQAGRSSRIENYLGFPAGLSGAELTDRARQQVVRFGAEVLTVQEAVGVTLSDQYRIVRLGDGTEVTCGALVVATGVSYRTLDVPGAMELTGAGIYYGAGRAEAMDHAQQAVFVIGGGNSAGQAAIYLSGHAATVTLLVRGQTLGDSMSRYLIDRLESTPNITIRYGTTVTEAKGEEHLESLTLQSSDGTVDTAPAAALFGFVGMVPRTEWVGDLVQRDQQGFILAGADLGPSPRGWPLGRPPLPLESSVPGIFVAGDVRFGSIKRVASAVGEGAMAVRFVHEHLATLSAPS